MGHGEGPGPQERSLLRPHFHGELEDPGVKREVAASEGVNPPAELDTLNLGGTSLLVVLLGKGLGTGLCRSNPMD